MARSRHRAKRRGPDRFALFGGAALLTMFTADTVRLLATGDIPGAAAYGLGMFGFTVTCLIIGLNRHRALTADQHLELNVITLRALGLVALGLIAQRVWGATVIGAPLAVTLTGAVLITCAGEAAKIALRPRTLGT